MRMMDIFYTIHNYPFRKVHKTDLAMELEAQIKALSSVMDLKDIDHISNHHGLVYFDTDLFEVYAERAAAKGLPIRSPMSWHAKFKGVKNCELPDYDDQFLSPTGRRGIKIGMWRKFGGILYGNVLKRMEYSSSLNVNYPDVLCEYIYGQCDPQKNNGHKVLDHVLRQFEDGEKAYQVLESNIKTKRKAGRKRLGAVEDVYLEKLSKNELAIELMFHLASNGPDDELLEGIQDDTDPHGINGDYIPTRINELALAKEFDWKRYEEELKLKYITYKDM
jgi:hypothetical protein